MRTLRLLQIVFVIDLIVLAALRIVSGQAYLRMLGAFDPETTRFWAATNTASGGAWVVAIACLLTGLGMILTRSRPTGVRAPIPALLLAVAGAALELLASVLTYVAIPGESVQMYFGAQVFLGGAGSLAFLIGLAMAVLWDPVLRQGPAEAPLPVSASETVK